jgi:hypothetical protein
VKKLLLASAAFALWCDAAWAQMPDVRKPDFASPAYELDRLLRRRHRRRGVGTICAAHLDRQGRLFRFVGAPAVTAAGMQTTNATGFVAGLEGGFNWQIGNLLLGLEADPEA